jgi:hypothetical protein
MTQDQARAALAFLDRVTLQPREISAFMAVAQALNDIATPAPKDLPADGNSSPVSQ